MVMTGSSEVDLVGISSVGGKLFQFDHASADRARVLIEPVDCASRDLLWFEDAARGRRSEEHTSELQSRRNLVWRLLLEKKNSSPS